MNQSYNKRKPLAAHLGDVGNGLTLAVKPWRGVFFDGPQPDQDPEGDEVPVWVVYVGNEDAEPVGQVYQCRSFRGAEALAQRMAKDRHLELIHEAMPV
jgi:hypothetical protein